LSYETNDWIHSFSFFGLQSKEKFTIWTIYLSHFHAKAAFSII